MRRIGRWVLYIVGAFVILVVIAGVIGTPRNAEPSAQAQATTSPTATVEATSAPPASTSAATPAPTPTVVPTPTDPVAQTEALMRQQFEGTNNMEQERLRSVEVTQAGESYIVTVGFNGDDNFGNGFIRAGMEMLMQDAYQALYTSSVPIQSATIAAYFPLVDQFGNESEEIVYQTTLDGPTASQINWDNVASVNWEAVWTLDLLHPAIQDD